MTDLKKLVLSLMQGGQEVEGAINAEIIQQHQGLFEELSQEDKVAMIPPKAYNPPQQMNYPSFQPVENQNIIKIDSLQSDRINVEDISHETEDNSYSLEKQEKEMIVRALKKNNFKRKYAALDLGISERTLYRKIKQYDIEDE
jgi:DNA-binding NtrC family response regulator